MKHTYSAAFVALVVLTSTSAFAGAKDLTGTGYCGKMPAAQCHEFSVVHAKRDRRPDRHDGTYFGTDPDSRVVLNMRWERKYQDDNGGSGGGGSN